MNNLYSTKLHQYFKDTWNLVHQGISRKDIIFSSENENPVDGVNAKMFE